jgi:hypothetical protein
VEHFAGGVRARQVPGAARVGREQRVPCWQVRAVDPVEHPTAGMDPPAAREDVEQRSGEDAVAGGGLATEEFERMGGERAGGGRRRSAEEGRVGVRVGAERGGGGREEEEEGVERERGGEVERRRGGEEERVGEEGGGRERGAEEEAEAVGEREERGGAEAEEEGEVRGVPRAAGGEEQRVELVEDARRERRRAGAGLERTQRRHRVGWPTHLQVGQEQQVGLPTWSSEPNWACRGACWAHISAQEFFFSLYPIR